MTSFKPLRTTDYNNGDPSDDPQLNPNITEPILASFPSNLPSGPALKKMSINLFQSEKPSKKGVRRVIKAEHKGIKYEAKSYSAEIQEKDQASDYYVAIFDAKDNKAYTIPIKGAYQYDQVIQTFLDEMKAARGGELEAPDNEAIKKMAYMDQKLQLVNSFGTNKSRKKV